MFRSPLCLCCTKQWLIVHNCPKNFGVLRGSLFNDRMPHFFQINIKVTSHFFCFPLCPPIPLCKSSVSVMSSCMCVCVYVWQFMLQYESQHHRRTSQFPYYIMNYFPSSFFSPGFVMSITDCNTTSQCNTLNTWLSSLTLRPFFWSRTDWLTDCLFSWGFEGWPPLLSHKLVHQLAQMYSRERKRPH